MERTLEHSWAGLQDRIALSCIGTRLAHALIHRALKLLRVRSDYIPRNFNVIDPQYVNPLFEAELAAIRAKGKSGRPLCANEDGSKFRQFTYPRRFGSSSVTYLRFLQKQLPLLPLHRQWRFLLSTNSSLQIITKCTVATNIGRPLHDLQVGNRLSCSCVCSVVFVILYEIRRIQSAPSHRVKHSAQCGSAIQGIYSCENRAVNSAKSQGFLQCHRAVKSRSPTVVSLQKCHRQSLIGRANSL